MLGLQSEVFKRYIQMNNNLKISGRMLKERYFWDVAGDSTFNIRYYRLLVQLISPHSHSTFRNIVPINQVILLAMLTAVMYRYDGCSI